MRSNMTGRIVDSYTNILTVKLFARARVEDVFVRDSIDEHTDAYRRQMRMTTLWAVALALMNGLLLVGTGGISIALWSNGPVPVGTVAMAIPMAWQIRRIRGWVRQSIPTTFDGIRQGQDGLRLVDQPT